MLLILQNRGIISWLARAQTIQKNRSEDNVWKEIPPPIFPLPLLLPPPSSQLPQESTNRIPEESLITIIVVIMMILMMIIVMVKRNPDVTEKESQTEMLMIEWDAQDTAETEEHPGENLWMNLLWLFRLDVYTIHYVCGWFHLVEERAPLDPSPFFLN